MQTPNAFQAECLLKKVRLHLDIHRERRIAQLQKSEQKLRDKFLTRTKVDLADLKEDLQICVGHYHKIRAMNHISRNIKFLEERSLMIEKGFKDRNASKEIDNIILTNCWGLYKLNNDQAPEHNHFFKPFVGDVTKMDNYVDRQLYFLLAWVIPQDIECMKYLKNFLERNQIKVDKIDHYGWIDGSLDGHINHLEKNEKLKSVLRSNAYQQNQQATQPQVPLMPQLPYTPPVQAPIQPVHQSPVAPLYPPTNPAAGGLGLPAFHSPNQECTQGELGLEIKEDYKDQFEKDLDFLKKDLNELKNDPKVSNIYEDVKRKEAINVDAMDKEFLEALKKLSGDPTSFGHQDGKTAAQANNPFDNISKTTSALIPQGGFTPQSPGSTPTVYIPSNFLPTTNLPSKLSTGPQQPATVADPNIFNMSGIQLQAHPSNQTGGFDMSAFGNKQPANQQPNLYQPAQSTNLQTGLNMATQPGFSYTTPVTNISQKLPVQTPGISTHQLDMYSFNSQVKIDKVQPLQDTEFVRLLRKVGV